MEKKFYFWAFQISKTVIFEVKYYILGNNEKPYFSTSANKFNRPKTDWNEAGQAQKNLLPIFSPARIFWAKWDKKHLQDLTNDEYIELLKDIEKLKSTYNYIEEDQTTQHHIGFWKLYKLSMQKLPNKNNIAKQFIF